MREQSKQNKLAWEYRAYEAWCTRDGLPDEKANRIKQNPLAQLKKHQHHFEHVKGKRIANLCGSNGRKAVPLALLGAEVTVFDISEGNKQYAFELAETAEVTIQYVVTDIYEIDVERYNNYFDMLYLEGGILHYFNDLDQFMRILYTLLKPQGVLILSDFHPLRRCFASHTATTSVLVQRYFDDALGSGDVAYKSLLTEEEDEQFPQVSVRIYTLSDIINALLTSGLTMKSFDEHRGWNGENIPWEFTVVAIK